MFNSKPRTSKHRRGFTLVELLVAITLFSIAVSVAIGGFVRALKTQRELISLIAANSNVSLAIEQMAREFRTGKDFACVDGSRYCTETSGGLRFTNVDGATVIYSISSNGVLQRQVGNETPTPFTAENVRIAYLRFDVPDTLPSRITVSLGVGVRNLELKDNVTNIQTSISSRAF